MNLETLFSIGNSLALIGWVFLLFSPWIYKVSIKVATIIIPVLLAIAYCTLVLVFGSGWHGGFDSLANVMQLFTEPSAVLAGWLHFLAFDLFVGAWIVSKAKESTIPFLLVLPCLLLAFMFGPAGYLLFVFIRGAQASVRLPQFLRWFTAEPVLAAAGVVIALTAIPLFLGFLVDTRALADVNVWVKPLKFHASLALYLITLAWFAQWLPTGVTERRGYRIYRFIVLVCIAAELVWIDGAALMGIQSHYNESNLLLAITYPAMGIAAVVLTSMTLFYGILIARHKNAALQPVMRFSVSMSLLLTFVLTLIAAGYLASGSSHWVGGNTSDAESLFLLGWARDGGDLRVAHFFATHAMHFLPAVSWLFLRRLPTSLGGVLAGLLGFLYSAAVLFTLYQATRGVAFIPI